VHLFVQKIRNAPVVSILFSSMFLSRHTIFAFVLVGGVLSPCCGLSYADDPDALHAILQDQAKAWNGGDLDAFMSAYWNNPELTFSSGGETTRGWDATLARYRNRYPDRDAMGRLTFSKLETQMLGKDAAFTLGRWHLDRNEVAQGNFTLVWRKMENGWRIVHDHSSSTPNPPPTP
jgi:beta-aspartyl-peptidase (threonine type)